MKVRDWEEIDELEAEPAGEEKIKSRHTYRNGELKTKKQGHSRRRKKPEWKLPESSY